MNARRGKLYSEATVSVRIEAFLLASLVLTLIGCGTPVVPALVTGATAAASRSGGGGSGAGAPARPAVSGRALYEKKFIDPLTASLTPVITYAPIPNALVELVSAPDEDVVASSATNVAGEFSFSLAESLETSTLFVRVTTKSSLGYAEVEVTDYEEALYAVASENFVGATAGLTLLATADDATGRIAGAFNIYAQALRGIQFVRAFDEAAQFPLLAIRWATGIDSESLACTCFSHEHPDGNIVFVIEIGDSAIDTDDFDDSVILHEFGHYLETVFSRFSSPGGTHLLGYDAFPLQDLDDRLAFSEGWADAFAQMVLGDPIFVNTPGFGFSLDLENPYLPVSGTGSESAISGVFWDLFDGTASGVVGTDPDTIDLGFGPIWQAMKALRSETHVYVGDFLAVLVNQGSIRTLDWDLNFASFGLGTPIPAFPSTFLPLGTLVDGTVNASLGQSSLYAANAYFEVEITASGTLEITLWNINPGTNDLDLLLSEQSGPAHPPGERLEISASHSRLDDGVVESIMLPVEPGTYLVQVRADDATIGSEMAEFFLVVDLR